MLVASGAVVGLGLHCATYLPFFSDDAFISLRYSQRLLAGNGLTWTDGERVEGYSNLLWVLLCAGLGALSLDLVSAARVLGALGTTAALAALCLHRCSQERPRTVVLSAACSLIVLSPAVAAWTIGGLEQPLLLGLLVWGTIAVLRAEDRPWTAVASVCFGLLCWTRPDGPLWGVSAAVACIWAFPTHGRRRALWVLGAVTVCTLSQLAFRWFYYGDVVPNTAHAKLTLTANHRYLGQRYLVDSLLPLGASWTCLGALLLRSLWQPRLRPAAKVIGGLAAPWTIYVVSIGGDIFPNWRHWVPIVGLSAVALCEVLRTWAASHESRSVVGALALLGFAAASARGDPGDRAAQELWEWNAAPVARTLRSAFPNQRPLLAVEAAGSLPFFTGFPALDMLGLNDRHLAQHPPEDFGTGPYGHGLGDGGYVLRRAPDLICFGTPPCARQPKYRGGRQLLDDPRFHARYLPVRLRMGQPGAQRGLLWIRRRGQLGMRRRGGSLEIPAFLLATTANGIARPSAAGPLVAELEPDTVAQVDGLRLRAGGWRVSSSVLAGSAVVGIVAPDEAVPAFPPDRLTIAEDGPATVRVQVGPEGAVIANLALRPLLDRAVGAVGHHE